MKVSHGLRRGVAWSLVVLALPAGRAFAQQPGGSAANGQSELRWTPHRAARQVSAPAAEGEQPATTSSPQTASTPSSTTAVSAGGRASDSPASSPRTASAPPASVGLPAGVPAVNPAPRPRVDRGPASVPPRSRTTDVRAEWKSDNRISGPFRSSTATGDGLSLPGFGEISMFRTPQGESGRPVLAVEGGAPTPPRGVTAPALGGGLAPRFNPADVRQSNGRRDRLAMNADGLPSVMTRSPQAAALDDTGVPGRLPSPAAAPTQPLPAPGGADPLPGRGEPPIVINTTPSEMTEYGDESYGIDAFGSASPADGMWMGDYPTELHVESFYDDPFACEESPGLLTCCPHDGRICAWLRQFGRPYYGWRWYRDFTAGAGIAAFQNQSNIGLLGNYGTNEFINWAMPFWNAFGIGWQVGARGVQSNFNQPTINDAAGALRANSRQQVFVTTGFFTRAFQGRGLQGGAVYDYLSDSYFDNVDVSQIRGELSYVWGYHELGFWGAFNVKEQNSLFSPSLQTPGVAGTVDLYTAFYRLHFGDANEARIWGGASGNGQGVIGTQIRAPMARSVAMEGTFTYLMPAKSQPVATGPASSVTFAPSAWNLAVNLVWYPAGRARRSLASPYRPLFDVADNGSMIRSLARTPTP